MIGHKSVLRLTGILYALVFGSIFSGMVLLIFPQLHLALKFLVIAVFLVSFYAVGVWGRPAARSQQENSDSQPRTSQTEQGILRLARLARPSLNSGIRNKSRPPKLRLLIVLQ